MTLYLVRGWSMAPTLLHGQRVLVRRLGRAPLRRGDIVVLREPTAEGVESVKRIVGLPGERVEVRGGRATVDGRALDEPYLLGGGGDGPEGSWRAGEGEHFVLGDNRVRSIDSRTYGPVRREHIVGRVWLCCWPPSRWGRVR